MSIRFDNGEIRKAQITPEGYLRAEAVFARDGVLEYRTSSGKIRRELRLPEENRKALTGFGLKPFTVEHPTVLVDSENASKYTKGMTDSTVVYDEGGFVRGVINVFDSEAVKSIQSGETVEISAGYQCDVVDGAGIWNGEHYDAVQRNLKINHVCATRKGRAGADVRILHLDSSNEEDIAIEVSKSLSNGNKKMAKIVLDGVEYSDVPEAFASVVSQKMNELKSATNRNDSLTAEVSQLNELREQLKEAKNESDRQMGRADGYEEVVSAAIPILEASNYYWDSDDRQFVQTRADGKGKMPPATDWEEDEEAEEEEEGDWEEEVEPKTKKKDKKKDSSDERTDSVSDLLAAWKGAERIVPGISESKFDSNLDCAGVRRLVVTEITKKDFADKSDDYIASRYDAIAETLTERKDIATTSRYVDELTTVVTTRTDAKKTSCGDCGMTESDKRRADNHKKPVGMSRVKG